MNTDQANNDNDGQGDRCDVDDDNDSVPDSADNCVFVANATQSNFDGDALGDVCDPDDDNDGVVDGNDLCFSTPLFTVVAPSNGCSTVQQCPCAGPRGTTSAWKNHGQYVSCVAQANDDLLRLGLLTQAQKDAQQSSAGESSCGRK